MAITMTFELNHPQGEPDIFVTTITCDQCGRLIEHDREGNYHWLAPIVVEDGAQFPAYFLHKTCWRSFEAEHHQPGHFWKSEALKALTTRLSARAKGVEES